MSTTSINWESVAGTIGGGTIKPLTGALKVTYLIADLGSCHFTRGSTGTSGRYRFITQNLRDTIKHIQSNIVTTAICSQYKAVKGDVGWGQNVNNVFWVDQYGDISIVDERYSDATAFESDMTDVKICYELVTPIEYQLTPTEIRSLLGINNIWADCGSITELKYIRDLNLCINDIITRIEALEGANSSRSLSLSPTLTKSLTSDSDTAEGILEGKIEETEEETKEEAQKNER